MSETTTDTTTTPIERSGKTCKWPNYNDCNTCGHWLNGDRLKCKTSELEYWEPRENNGVKL